MKFNNFIGELVKKKKRKNEWVSGSHGDLKSYLIIRFNCRSISFEVFKEAILPSFAFQI